MAIPARFVMENTSSSYDRNKSPTLGFIGLLAIKAARLQDGL